MKAIEQTFVNFRSEHGIAKAAELIEKNGGRGTYLSSVPEENLDALAKDLAAYAPPQTLDPVAIYAKWNAAGKQEPQT